MAVTRRQTLKISLGGLLGGIAASSVSTRAHAAKATWNFADEYNANTSPGRTALYFIAELEKKIGDELKIVYQGSGALGYKSIDHFNAVEDGAVEIAFTQSGQLAGIDPVMEMSNLPFLVKDTKQSQTLWDVARPEYAKVFEGAGQRLLFAAPSPPAGVHSIPAMDNPSALQGLKIRTWDRMSTETLGAAGAAPIQAAWSDIVPLLSTGAISAVLTAADAGASINIWDFVKHFAPLNYSMALQVAHVNAAAFDGLPQNVQDAILGLVDPVCDFSWGAIDSTVAATYDAMRAHGMTVNLDPPGELFDKLRQAGEAAKTAWLGKVGDRGQELLSKFEAAIL